MATISAAARSRAARPAAPAVPTREVILDTAERLFAARGVDGVTMRDLAREMGLTAPSLYNHFPSKQALHDAVLERGLHPIVEFVGAAWHPDGFRPERMRTTVDQLTMHLAAHPHLARLLQRAMLEESGNFQVLVSRWLRPIYREGIAVMREAAAEAGWTPDELPYMALGLFGMVFAYFINGAAWQSLAAWPGGFASERSVAREREFLGKALYRLLGAPGETPSVPRKTKRR